MLGRCPACQGFLPSTTAACPNCGACHHEATGAPRRGLLERAGILAGAAVASMTLMACYGAPYDYDAGCYSDADCGAGYTCDTSINQCLAAPTEQCGNGIDDDEDGLVDCADTNSCNCTFETSCNNGFDDDHDGQVDCADADCQSVCPSQEICGDHIDNDHDGLTDCQDPICGCGFETNCANGVDDDQDGYFDCQDPDCASQCSVHESECANKLDDDVDGLIDCLDPDCLSQAICGGHELQCHDGKDDDADGAIDCKDGDCPACPDTESVCNDGYDDDADGAIDCADSDCTATCAMGGCGDGVVVGTEECDDGANVDGDGCSANCAVEPQAFCDGLGELPMGVSMGTTVNQTNAFAGTCTPASGFEVAYAFTPASNGTLYLTLDAQVDMALVVNVGCGDFASELDCRNAAPAGQLESVAIDVPAGAPLSVFVDSAAGTPGAYTLIANFVPQN
ncbi:MAG: hypothetical protein U0414_01495 [Polyangiaceae bacterium]